MSCHIIAKQDAYARERNTDDSNGEIEHTTMLKISICPGISMASHSQSMECIAFECEEIQFIKRCKSIHIRGCVDIIVPTLQGGEDDLGWKMSDLSLLQVQSSQSLPSFAFAYARKSVIGRMESLAGKLEIILAVLCSIEGGSKTSDINQLKVHVHRGNEGYWC